MNTILDLPQHVLVSVFSEINQHQALVLGPLHSRLQAITKVKLYQYIYLYESDFSYMHDGDSGHRFPKYLNNPRVNKYTIISTETLREYIDRMDGNQPIISFDLQDREPMEPAIKKRFKNIKYFNITSSRELERWGRADKYEALDREDRESRIGGYYSNSISAFRDNRKEKWRLYIPPKVFPEYNSGLSKRFDDFSYISELNVRLHSERITDVYPLKLKKLHVQFDKPLESCCKLEYIFTTLYLQELYIVGEFDFTSVFSKIHIDDLYPNLVILGIRKVNHEETNHSSQEICTVKHRSIRKVVVSTNRADNTMALRVCSLCSQFPRASIHWWESIHRLPGQLVTRRFDIEEQSDFSPSTIEPRTVGFHWYYNSATPPGYSFKLVSNFRYRVLRHKNGRWKKRGVITLKRYNNEFALGAMMAMSSDYMAFYSNNRRRFPHCV
ncbi:hypothetical protein KGF57_005149 [Candida theae]|uniref:F-box domain-containing protein n=1 Tax=Candida theae TaxID=1198502 RepID=A0AAD5BA35_9ASCO|nr:uncharacterized protein KGF57_005149 [Candida theae]KAI5948751.1 hypothetical protein KGF57_005149 [Candida theae]